MKKNFSKGIVALALVMSGAMTSCTDEFAPNVNFGATTFINDYSKLVDAVNNLTKNMNDRFEALNTILDQGFAYVQVSIDENTGAIKAQTTTLDGTLNSVQSTLDKINTSVFNGFKALNETVVSLDEHVVYALNDNGEILKLQLDKTGKLLSAQIETSTSSLVSTLNSNNSSLVDKLSALETTINSGLVDLKVQVKATGDQLDVQLGNINSSVNAASEAQVKALGELAVKMLEGFTAVKTSVDTAGNKVVTSMDKNGNLLRTTIDSNGKLVSTTIAESVSALIKQLQNSTAALSYRLKAINSTIETGLFDIKVQVKNTGDQISVEVGNVNSSIQAASKAECEKLASLIETILNGFTVVDTQMGTMNSNLGTINTTIGDKGDLIVTAIDQNGQTIALQIDKSGNLIACQVRDSLGEIGQILADQTQTLKKRINALNEALSTGLATLTAQVNTTGVALETKLGKINTSINNASKAEVEQLSGIATQLLNGFTVLDTRLTKVNGEIKNLVSAVNANGEIIKVAIDGVGKIVEVNVCGSLADISAKLESANSTLEQKLASIAEAVNAGVGQLEITNQKLQFTVNQLTGINGSLADMKTDINNISLRANDVFEEFKTLNTKMDGVVFAINASGWLIRFGIDAVGNIIQTNVCGSLADISNKLTSNNANIVEKLQSIADVVEAGLGKIDVTNQKLQFVVNKLDGTNASLASMSTDINNISLRANDVLGQFVVLNGKIGDVITAVNTNGDIIKIAINSVGQIIETNVCGSLADISGKLTSNNNAVTEKLEAIATAIEAGFGKIEVTNQKLQFVVNQLTNMNTTASAIATDINNISLRANNILEQFVVLNGKMGDVIYAVNTNGTIIATEITKAGQIIETNVCGSLADISAKLSSHTTSMAEKLDAINTALATGLLDADGDAILFTVNATIDSLNNSLETQTQAIADAANALVEKADVIAKQIKKSGNKITASIDEVGAKIDYQTGQVYYAIGGVYSALTTLTSQQLTQLNSIIDEAQKLNATLEGVFVTTGTDGNQYTIAQLVDQAGQMLFKPLGGYGDATLADWLFAINNSLTAIANK